MADGVKVMIHDRLLDALCVPDAQGQGGPARHDAEAIAEGADVRQVQNHAAVCEKEAVVVPGALEKLRGGHPRAEGGAVREGDLQIVAVGDGIDDIPQKDAGAFPLMGKVDKFMRGGKEPARVVQHALQALAVNGLGDIIKGVAGKGLRHELPAGGEEDQNAARVRLPQDLRRGDAVRA